MLILHVVPPSLGGMRQHVFSLVAGLHSERFRSAVACLAPDLGEAGGSAPPFPAATYAVGAPGTPAAPARLRHLIRSLNPAIVHCHGSRAALATRVALSLPAVPARQRVPVIYTVHGPSAPNTPWKRALIRAAERRLSRGISAYVAVSRWVAAETVREWGVPAERVHLIPNGVDPARFAQLPDAITARLALGLDPARPVVGMAGRLAREKGPDLFVHAARLVHRRHPECRFLIAGDGPEREHLRTLAASLGLREAVTFAGQVRDMTSALAAMDVYVLPSRAEAISIGLMEAMAAGRAVVASGVGGVSEVATHRLNALVVTPDDPYGLSQSVSDLLRNDDLRRRLGVAARQRIAAHFTLDAMVRRTEHLYTVLTHRRTGPAEARMDAATGAGAQCPAGR